MIPFFLILGKAEYQKKKYLGRELAVARILVSGASGLIGSAVVRALRQRGDTVLTLTRHRRGLSGAELYWNPEKFFLEEGLLAEFDTVIHLAGAPIADGRWSDARKKRIWDSRIRSTRLLVDNLLREEKRPKRVLCASAIGYYGTSLDAPTDEWGAQGSGFLADLCGAWEHETALLAMEGVSCVSMRFGMVVSPDGGALVKILPLFRLGLGGRLGSGSQFLSWISLYDAVAAILFLIDHPDIDGVVNVTSPAPTTNALFSEALAHAVYENKSSIVPLWRAAPMAVPAWLLKIVLGEMATETVLASQNVLPRRLATSGFHWRDSHIGPALRQLLA